MEVVREKVDGKQTTKVSCDYHPEFVQFAHQMKAKYNGTNKAWYFDGQDEESVRHMLKRIYGTDGTDSPQTVDVRIDLDVFGGYYKQEIVYGGRCVVHRARRDADVRIGRAVIIESGGFPEVGGSMRNPALHADDDTVLLVKHIPVALATQMEGVEILTPAPAPSVVEEKQHSSTSIISAMKDIGLSEDTIAAVLSKLSADVE